MIGSAQIAFKAGPRPQPAFDPNPALGEIVFTRSGALTRVPISGGTATPLGVDGTRPCWSPDGRIAYIPSFGGLTVTDGDGTNAVAFGLDGYDSPSWSPDGSKILAVGYNEPTATYRVVWIDPVTHAVTTVYTATEFFYIGLSTQPWNPTGDRVVWVNQSYNRVYTVKLDGTGLTEITPSGFPFADMDIDRVSWSPDGTRMAIASLNHFTMKPDGTVLRRRWAGGGGTLSTGALAWSPDSRRIAFADGGGIQVMNVDGSGLTRVSSSPGADYLDWSKRRGTTIEMRGVPNFVRTSGQAQIAFRSGPKPTPRDPQPGLGALLYNSQTLAWSIYRGPTVVGGTGSRIWNSWAGEDGAFNPAWAPDGRIALVADNGDLVIADGDGSNPAAISSGRFVDMPSWSPDGLTILGYDYSDLVAIDVASNTARAVVSASDFGVNLSTQAWSHDQIQVVFTDTYANHVWVVNADGTNLTEITPIGVGALATPATNIRFAAFSPVEDKLAICDGHGVYISDDDGNNVRLVYASTGVKGLAWSPDGKKLVLNNNAGLAVINTDGTGLTQVNNDPSAWRPDWSRQQPPITMAAVTGGPGPPTTVSMTGSASFGFTADAALWYPPLGPRISATFYDRWRSGLHIGDARPAQRVQVRRGRYFRRHGKWLGSDPMHGVKIAGYNLSNPWQAYWTPQSAYVTVPNVREVRLDQSTDQNGITTATFVIDNIFYRPEAGGQHSIERGQFAPLRGYVAPSRTRLIDEQGQAVGPDATWFGLLLQDAQITVRQSYGNQGITTFTGLIDDVDTTSQPDVITVTARDFGKVLTDSFMFGWNKEVADEGETPFRDPTIFIDPDDADDVSRVGSSATASSGSGAANTLDTDGDTQWTSDRHTTPAVTEYVQIRLPEGRYDDFRVNVESDGMEMYVSLLVKNLKNGDHATRNGVNLTANTWVNGSGGALVPGDNGGIYYIRHFASVSQGAHVYSLTSDEDVFRTGDDSILRLSFRDLQRPAGSTRYAASVTALSGRRRTLKVEAKKQHWVLVEDAADVVRTVLRWAGFKEFEVEDVGAPLNKRFVVNRGMSYIEVIKRIADISGYIFFMSDPSGRSDSLGVPVFRKTQIVTNVPSVVTVKDTDLLTAIDVKQTDEPLAYIIRMRGREAKKGGSTLGGDSTKRVTYVYRPPWSGGHTTPVPTAGVRPTSHELGGVIRHVIHTDNMFKTVDDCKFACFYLALNEALAASTTTIQIPANPGIQLDDHVELLDLGTGITSRLSVQQRSSGFVRSGEQTEWTMTLGGGLVDTPDITDVVLAINSAKRH
jgi:Tol biopolymer transport system component